jgi:two-component system, OmpR family, alkaline phosphatase synthesis response regulator PhoP
VVGVLARRGPGDHETGAPRPAAPPKLSLVGGSEREGQERRVLRVLLVEDDASMAMLCRFNLELSGFEVVTAETGAEGLERATTERFDLVLLDVMLPDLGGLEVAERLRGSAAPIVFMSARDAEDDIERGRQAGAIDYVPKPFDPVELPARLRGDLEELERAGVEGVWRLRYGPRS